MSCCSTDPVHSRYLYSCGWEENRRSVPGYVRAIRRSREKLEERREQGSGDGRDETHLPRHRTKGLIKARIEFDSKGLAQHEILLVRVKIVPLDLPVN